MWLRVLCQWRELPQECVCQVLPSREAVLCIHSNTQGLPNIWSAATRWFRTPSPCSPLKTAHLWPMLKRGSTPFLQVDMLVGDIYGGRDYSNIGLSATTIASSFGKVSVCVTEALPAAAGVQSQP